MISLKNNINSFVLLFSIFVLMACKKDAQITDPEEILSNTFKFKDSISFTVAGKSYDYGDINTSGYGNLQVNVKPYTVQIPERKAASITGNYFFYGEADSTLYHRYYSFQSDNNKLQLFFSKKLHKRELTKSYMGVNIPENNSSLYKVGKYSLAVDFEKENTKEGIALNVYLPELKKTLSSYRPGFSILVRPDLGMDIQDDATFEIISIEKVDQDNVFIKARFQMNLYDDPEGKKYKLENGYAQIITKISNPVF